MGLFTLLRFLTPNNGVSVSELPNDLTTTAALGLAVENLDTYAARTNGSNTATAAMTLDLSLVGVNTFKTRVAAGAVPTVDGAVETDSTSHALVRGRNGSTVTVLDSGAAVSIAQGGTGAAALTNHGVVTAGASALTTVAPGASSNVLTSNGTDWTSAAAPAGNPTILPFASTGSTPQNITTYFGTATGSVTENLVSYPLASAVTLTKFYAKTSATPGGSDTWTYTIMKNGVAGAITVIQASGATTANDTAHSVAFAAGDTISTRDVGTATATNGAGIGFSYST